MLISADLAPNFFSVAADLAVPTAVVCLCAWPRWGADRRVEIRVPAIVLLGAGNGCETLLDRRELQQGALEAVGANAMLAKHLVLLLGLFPDLVIFDRKPDHPLAFRDQGTGGIQDNALIRDGPGRQILGGLSIALAAPEGNTGVPYYTNARTGKHPSN